MSTKIISFFGGINLLSKVRWYYHAYAVDVWKIPTWINLFKKNIFGEHDYIMMTSEQVSVRSRARLIFKIYKTSSLSIIWPVICHSIGSLIIEAINEKDERLRLLQTWFYPKLQQRCYFPFPKNVLSFLNYTLLVTMLYKINILLHLMTKCFFLRIISNR